MARDNQTTVKQRAARIPLDYFQRKSALERSKQWLAIAAVLGGIGYVAWSAFGGPEVVKHYSPGKLSNAHAMWENRCDACHQSFVPLGANAWTPTVAAADSLCMNCHQGAPDSHKQIAAEVASCATCHQEHGGRNSSIIRTADSDCTVCHANISAHLNADAKPSEPPLANVTSFLSDHPDFRSAKRSDSQIKFSHSRHMQPGLSFGRGPVLLKDLAAADRARYQKPGQTDESMVTLDCASCHRLDTGSAADHLEFSSGVRPAGDYMLPIQFNSHCAACHQLTTGGAKQVIATAPSPSGSGPGEGAETLSATSLQNSPRMVKGATNVPHGIEGDELTQFINQLIAAKVISSAGDDLQKLPLSKLAGEPLEKWRLPNRQPQTDKQAGTIGEYMAGELKTAVNRLQLQCAECHQMASTTDPIKVQPVQMRPAWFRMARFDHAAHRAVSCESCHGGAFPAALPSEPTTLNPLDSSIFIPGRKLCLDCHSPATGSGASAKGGARFDCVECHRYHNGDEPWHGRGAPARGAKDRLQIEDFINGESWKAKAPEP